MLLTNVTPINGNRPVHVQVAGEKITLVSSQYPGQVADGFKIHFTSATVFPGLINSHDHLDFNCYSVLCQRKFTSYTEWGLHIHQVYKAEIEAIQKIPQDLRSASVSYTHLTLPTILRV